MCSGRVSEQRNRTSGKTACRLGRLLHTEIPVRSEERGDGGIMWDSTKKNAPKKAEDFLNDNEIHD